MCPGTAYRKEKDCKMSRLPYATKRHTNVKNILLVNKKFREQKLGLYSLSVIPWNMILPVTCRNPGAYVIPGCYI